MKNIGEKIKRRRLELGLTPTQLAKESGVSQAYIWALETGAKKSPSIRIVKALASALRVDPEYLVDDLAVDPKSILDLPPDIEAWLRREDIMPYLHWAKEFHEAKLPPAKAQEVIKFIRTLMEIENDPPSKKNGN